MLQRRFIALCSGLLIFITIHAQVNLQTGSATFSLPMFNWKDDKSRLNTLVALSYSSGSGVKTGEVASNVGQGWNLVAGGFITRMPIGEPDDQQAYGSESDNDLTKYPNGILYAFSNNSPDKGCHTALTRYPIYRSKNQRYKQHNAVAVDKQLDYFSFQFNGKSGMFVVNPGIDGGCKMLGDSKMKITFATDANNLQLQGIRTTITSFTIQDVDGLIYRFRVHGLTKVLESKFCDRYMTAEQTQPNFKSRGVYYQSGFENPAYVRPWLIENWYLDEIEDAFTHRKIIFNYDITEIINLQAGADVSYDSWHNYVIVTYKKSIEQIKLLTSINCPDGHKVIFNYNKNREDLPGDKALTSVDVTYTSSRAYIPETRNVSRHLLNTSYFILNRYGTPSTFFEKKLARLCLRSVKKIGPDLKEDAPPYTFDYYTGSNAGDDIVPPPFCVSRDIWGFYNGSETTGYNGETILPILNHSSLEFEHLRGLCYLRYNESGMKLNVKAGYAKNGLLKQIIYPTGGTLSYEYEQNTGVLNGVTINVGGVHVSGTKSTDGGFSNSCDNPITTQYNYVMNGPGSASSLWGLEMPDNSGEMTMNYSPEKKNYRWSIRKCGGGIHGCCYWVYQYPGIASQPQALSLTGFQRFMINAEPVMSYLSAVMTVVDIIIVATSSTGPGAIVALVIDVIASYLQLALTCRSDNTKHGTSVSYYSFDMNGVSPLPMQFKRVEVVEGSGVNGKTVYEFTNTDHYALWDQNNPNLTTKQRFAPWAYGLPKKITIYGADEKKVKETEYDYAFIKTPIITLVQSVIYSPAPVVVVIPKPLTSCKCNIKSTSSQRSDDWIQPEKYNVLQTTSDEALAVEIYPLFAGRAEMTKTYEREYKRLDDNMFVETVTAFTYGSNYEVQTVSTVLSDGSTKTKTIKYSGDLSGGIIDLMKQNNVISVPVSTKESVTGTINGYINETANEFTQAAGDIKPLRTLEQRTDRPTNDWTDYTGPASTNYSKYKVTELFSYDVYGNLVTAKDEGGRSVANIYDYKNKYIVASVVNADASVDKPAYTSFETESLGGWQFSANPVYVSNNAVTGSWVLNLAFNTGWAPLNASKPYILSFWANNSNVVVTAGATLVKSAPLINGFTYYEYTIAAGTQTVGLSGNALIDELRVYPKVSRMRTVTYDPLIGKTSECDENNRIAYYEYDNLARLRFIKDESKNIVKMYEYNNVSKQNGCPGLYYNKLLIEYFTKSTCGTDQVGSDEPYTVPANKYSSVISQEDADAKAEQEALVQGQKNADDNGSCKLIYYNAAVSKAFETENCPEGSIGGNVTYTVPARKYSSLAPGEADQMALDEINANGQAYANDPAHAVCTINTDPEWVWEEGGQTECRVVNGEGHLFKLYKNVNPNSSATTAWLDAGPDASCPNGPIYSDDMSGNYLPTNCAQGWEPYPTPVSMPAGSFVSYINKDDANAKARAEAQRIANTRNSCVGPLTYVDVSTSRWPNDGALLEIVFTNLLTGEQYFMYDTHESMPEGTYYVYLNVSYSSHSSDYDLYMCGLTSHDINGITMYIGENHCNKVYVFPHQH